MHTSFWSLTSCNEARQQALDKHHDIQVALCVPEEDGTDTWYGQEAARNEHEQVIQAEMDAIEVEVVK